MIEITRFEDVQRLQMWSWRSTVVGYDVSAYLVRGVLVDTGFRQAHVELDHALDALRPRAVVVTHSHEDHAGNAPSLVRKFPMWIAKYTEDRLRERPQVKLYRHWTWGRPLRLLGSIMPADVSPLHVIATPGHSPDHHVVWDPDSATLFSADLFLGVKVRAMSSSENPYQLLQSLARVIGLQPRRMFDAHRGLVEHPVEALTAKRTWLEETVGEIERRLGGGQGERQIVREVLGREDGTAFVSEGEYSRRNFVRLVARSRPQPAADNRRAFGAD